MNKYYKIKLKKLLKNIIILIINNIILQIKSLFNREENLINYINHLIEVSKVSMKLTIIFTFIWCAVCFTILNNRQRFFNYISLKCPVLIDTPFTLI